ASGPYSWAGQAAGVAARVGAAVAGVAWQGAAAGFAPTAETSGFASAEVGWSATATGARTSSGHAVGTYGWSGAVLDHQFVTGVDSSGRFFTDANGRPILVCGDSPWAIMVDASATEVDTYLANQAGLGFNLSL